MVRICLVALLPAVLVCCGCAVFNPENTPTTNWLQKALTPPDRDPTFGETFVLWTGGALTMTLDAVIVHPAMSFDDAWHDTVRFLWSDLDWEGDYVTECARLPLRAVATPFVYIPMWLKHSILDVKREETVRPEELVPETDKAPVSAPS